MYVEAVFSARRPGRGERTGALAPALRRVAAPPAPPARRARSSCASRTTCSRRWARPRSLTARPSSCWPRASTPAHASPRHAISSPPGAADRPALRPSANPTPRSRRSCSSAGHTAAYHLRQGLRQVRVSARATTWQRLSTSSCRRSRSPSDTSRPWSSRGRGGPAAGVGFSALRALGRRCGAPCGRGYAWSPARRRLDARQVRRPARARVRAGRRAGASPGARPVPRA